MSKGRVLVAMSGGIDSSVTAALLHDQGYEVVGITMKTWDYANSGGNKGKETGCCSLDSINDARQVAVTLGFPHFIIDIREEFGDSVIEYFVEEYVAGRTPNPCVMCNTHIKWDALIRRADELGCEFLATGHYANLRREMVEGEERMVISRGKDAHKDQAYVLWGVKQSALQRTRFPMGGYHKDEIRQMATDMGFDFLTKKPESYEICFIPDNDYHGFLKRRVDGLEEEVSDGSFVLSDGTVVGQHDGYPFYTIGQRRGLVAMGTPHYVTHIDAQTNTVTIGPEDELYRSTFKVKGVNLIKYASLPAEGMEVLAQIRYNSAAKPAYITPTGEGELEVKFSEPVKAIAPGQAAVFYDGDDVIGGGWIHALM